MGDRIAAGATVELLPAGMDPSIQSDVFACYECGVLKIEHRVDDVRNLTHSTEGMELRQRRMISLACIGVLMLPGDTVLNRMLFAAYSNAKALLPTVTCRFPTMARRSPGSYGS
jgi:hypothetical protein